MSMPKDFGPRASMNSLGAKAEAKSKCKKKGVTAAPSTLIGLILQLQRVPTRGSCKMLQGGEVPWISSTGPTVERIVVRKQPTRTMGDVEWFACTGVGWDTASACSEHYLVAAITCVSAWLVHCLSRRSRSCKSFSPARPPCKGYGDRPWRGSVDVSFG